MWLSTFFRHRDLLTEAPTKIMERNLNPRFMSTGHHGAESKIQTNVGDSVANLRL